MFLPVRPPFASQRICNSTDSFCVMGWTSKQGQDRRCKFRASSICAHESAQEVLRSLLFPLCPCRDHLKEVSIRFSSYVVCVTWCEVASATASKTSWTVDA